jgi:hypothetical protein
MGYSNQRPKSIALKGSPQLREYRTFEDWKADQQKDQRTPEQRGIQVGSSVMWRHRTGNVIVTDRATVTAISENTLTLLVKDIQERTCDVDLSEIVVSETDRSSAADAARRAAAASAS